MQPIDRMLVGVSLEGDDAPVLDHAGFLAGRLGAGSALLVHVVPRPESGHPPPTGHAEERLAHLRDAARDSFPSDLELQTRLVAGVPGVELLRLARERRADLVCLGRTIRSPRSRLGTDARTVVHKSPCSVLLVPCRHARPWNHVLVPTDFSERSADALQLASTMLLGTPGGRLTALHVYEVPPGSYSTGHTFADAVGRARFRAQEAWNAFCSGLVLAGPEPHLRLDLDPESRLKASHHARTVLQAVSEEDPDVVVLGSRGRGRGASWLIGSLAARLVEEADRPMLVLRRRGDNLNLLEALLDL